MRPAGLGRRPFTRMLFGPMARGEMTPEQTRREMIAHTIRLFADRTRCPLLVVCGDRDPLYEQNIELDVALARAGKEHEFRVFRGEAHGLIYHGSERSVAEAWEMTLDFFGRRLRR